MYARHIRKKELDQIKAASGAEIVWLDAGKGKKTGDPDPLGTGNAAIRL